LKKTDFSGGFAPKEYSGKECGNNIKNRVIKFILKVVKKHHSYWPFL